MNNEIPQEVRERAQLELARQHYKYYLNLVHNGNYKPLPHTELIAKELQRIIDGEQRHIIIEMPPRHGKLCADSTPIYTPNGWTTHGELKVGDYVYHPSGKAIKVTHIKPKLNADWVVTFNNGEKIRTHEQHEWTVYNRSKRRYETLETQQMKDDCYNGNRCRYQLQNIAALEKEEKRLPLPPYVLGAWLGDGSRGKPCITHDVNDMSVIDRIIENGFEVSTQCVHKETGVYTTYFSGSRYNESKISKALKELNIFKDKYIPDIYLQSSIAQRLELLAGLIDTDGNCDSKSRIRFTTVDKKLKDTVIELCNSLGFRPYCQSVEPQLSSSGIQGKQKYYVVGFNPTMYIPCALKRKRPKRFIKQRRIGIKSIEYKPDGELGHCITVDSNDGLYLVGNTLLPTHNSLSVTETFPSYFVGKHPNKKVIVAAYGDGLARHFGRLNRNKFIEYAPKVFNVEIANDNGSVADWSVLDNNGGMISTGIGGSITGKGADCFVAGTMIDTKIGKMDIKDLHEMKDKPKVLSYNHKKKKQEYKRIVASREVNKKSYHMTIETTEGNTVTCTPDHPFYIVGEGYVPISKAKVSDKFLTNSNTYDTSTDFDIYPSDNTIFYDIQVEDNHNFYAGNLLVHNCLIIDDPIKNAQDAQSKTMRERVWQEWESTLSTRLHKGASVIVIMTRWHEDDFVGRLLENSPFKWERLRLPAIAEDENDILGRNLGEPLSRELGFDEHWAESKKIEVGSRTWASLYQQRPAPEQGSIFKREWLQFVDYVPTRYDDMLISWDMTFKDSNASDYVVGQVWLKDKANYYCIEQVRGQMDFTQSMQAVINLKNKYPRCRRILIEDKANGPAIINTLKNRISGIIPITPKESKEARAFSVTPLFEAGNVFFYRNIRELSDMVEEIVGFPAASHDKNLSWINSVNCREPLRA